MAAAGFRLLSTWVILLVGFNTCYSLECTRENLYDTCHMGTIINGCQHFRKLIACLKSMMPCTDDILGLDVEAAIRGAQMSIDHCPGLPDGRCLSIEIGACNKEVPYNVLIPNSSHFKMADDDRKEACRDFKAKTKGVTACLEKIKPKCVPQGYIDYIQSVIDKTKEVDAYCATLLA